MTGSICQTKNELDPSWPSEVAMILSAMEAGDQHEERREMRRNAYYVQAELRLLADPRDTGEKLLYTRDVNPRSLGFLTRHLLPLGYAGIVELPSPKGMRLSARCTLLRCRQAAPGWYEGALHFNRDLAEFTPE